MVFVNEHTKWCWKKLLDQLLTEYEKSILNQRFSDISRTQKLWQLLSLEIVVMDPSQGSITLPLVNDEMLVNGAENNGFMLLPIARSDSDWRTYLLKVLRINSESLKEHLGTNEVIHDLRFRTYTAHLREMVEIESSCA